MTQEATTNSTPSPVRKLACDVYTCLLLDVWPSPAGIQDFGIETERHYGALQYAVRDGDVTPEQLDEALGNGKALTALIRPDNPYYGVEFSTAWDNIMTSIKEWADPGAGGTFPLGRLFATPNALKTVPQADIARAVKRHAAGDWGVIGDEDKARNDEAVHEGGRLLSVYRSRDGEAFWILTEADRSATTVLMPEDY